MKLMQRVAVILIGLTSLTGVSYIVSALMGPAALVLTVPVGVFVGLGITRILSELS